MEELLREMGQTALHHQRAALHDGRGQSAAEGLAVHVQDDSGLGRHRQRCVVRARGHVGSQRDVAADAERRLQLRPRAHGILKCSAHRADAALIIVAQARDHVLRLLMSAQLADPSHSALLRTGGLFEPDQLAVYVFMRFLGLRPPYTQ